MAEISKQDALEELKRRGVVVNTGDSIFEDKEDAPSEFKKWAESTFKGSLNGVLGILGGWGNLYDKVQGNKTPSALSTAGMATGIKEATGVDTMQIPGYRGAYEFGQTAAPAALFSAGGMGLFKPSMAGVAGDAAIAGTVGSVASTIAPDSPMAQFLMNAAPAAVGGTIGATRNSMLKQQGTMPQGAPLNDMMRVGPMTPGEAAVPGTGRVQMANEARIEGIPEIENRAQLFRVAQSRNLEGFLDNLFSRASQGATSVEDVRNISVAAFNNYGKSLSSRLRSDANKDFGAAKNSGGMVSTSPVVSAVAKRLSELPPEIASQDGLRNSLQRILEEYYVPAVPEQITPSTILGPTGKPASVNITPAIPAQLTKISIKRLQENLSEWGQAAYSGTANFGKGNIFEGVAPGVAKGVARDVLNGFKKSLDEAIDSGVPGAEQLIKARDNFKANLGQIEEFANRPIVKAFDVETPTALTAEVALAKIKNAKPSERAFLAQVLNNHPHGMDVFDTVRRSHFDDILTKSQNLNAKAGDPTFLIDVALREMNKKNGEFGFLFTSPKEAADASAALQWMRSVAKTEAPAGAAGAGSDIYMASRNLGADSSTGLGVKSLYQLIKDKIATPEDMATVMFNPDTVEKMAAAQRRSTPKKIQEAIISVSQALARQAAQAGPRMDTTQPVDTQQQQLIEQTDVETLNPDEARQELIRRGVIPE